MTVSLALLGGLGAVARYVVHSAVVRVDPTEFPLATFAVNVVGSLLLGVLVGVGAGDDARKLAGTAVLGAFTTFSTWMWETERLVADGERRGAATGVLTSLLIGLGAAALGVAIGRAI
ncbi:MAG: fluoride efflux transporter CrcB [Actinobacteria bacterium]|nr:fluoride efflux transporter CrcB [Actinomycetota bacterium]